MQTVSIYDDYQSLSEGAANFIREVAHSSTKANGKFTIALSGGSTPKQLFELLSNPPYSDEIDWKNTFVFWGDERNVPANSNENNSFMAGQMLLQRVNIPRENIFPVQVELGPEEAAKAYEKTIRNFFDDDLPKFDVNLLGMGDNGHTASLFPHTSILKEVDALVKEVYVEEVGMYRISFTVPLINAAHNNLFMVSGSNKANMLARALEGPYDPEEIPTQLIISAQDQVFFYVDKDAAAELKDV